MCHSMPPSQCWEVSDSSLLLFLVKAAAAVMCQLSHCCSLLPPPPPPPPPQCVTVSLLFVSGHAEAGLAHKESSQHKGQISIGSSDSEVEIVGVQEKAR